MNRFIAGAGGMMLLMTAGFFVWMGAQSQDVSLPDAPPPPQIFDTQSEQVLPIADETDMQDGPAPPAPPKAYRASREEKRFNRYDRDRDEIITRLELMSSRTKAFKKLDVDGNNLLTFEEWAKATSDRFAGADKNGNGQLTRAEFRTTRPKRKTPKCKC